MNVFFRMISQYIMWFILGAIVFGITYFYRKWSEKKFQNNFEANHQDIIRNLEKAQNIDDILKISKEQSDKAINDFYTNAKTEDYLLRGCLKYRYVYLDYLIKEYSENNPKNNNEALNEALKSHAKLFMEEVNKHFKTNLSFTNENDISYTKVIELLALHLNKRYDITNIATTFSAVVKTYIKYVDKVI